MTERVSVGPRGVQGNGDSNFLGISTAPAISDDGRYVAFKSDASNLVKGDRNDLTDVFVRDRGAGATERISGDGGGDNPGYQPRRQLRRLRDVRLRRRLRAGHLPAQSHHRRDRADQRVIRRQRDLQPERGSGGCKRTGACAFASGAPNLVPNDGSQHRRLRARPERPDADDGARAASRATSSRRASSTRAGIPQSRATAASSPSSPTPRTSPPPHRRRSSAISSCVTARTARRCSRARAALAARPPGRARIRRSAPTVASSRSRRSPRI